MRRAPTLTALSILFWLAVIWSAVRPFNPKDYVLEIATPVGGFLILLTARRRLPFTTLAYALLFLEGLVLVAGAHYTHERVPLGEWIKPLLGTERNDYDRLAHFCVGLLLFVPVREVLWRRTPLRGRWLEGLAIGVILAWAAFYEITEWWIAVSADPAAGAAYLGSQGDPWDTQKDMLMDGLGGLAGVLVFRRAHDAQLEPDR